MGAPSEYFCDIVGGTDDTVGDRGSVIGNPWKTVQFALDNITQDTTNGDLINIKTGGLNTLAAALDLSTYGTPTLLAPLIFRGYTSVAKDGGRGDLNGDDSFAVMDGSPTGVSFIDMACWKSGSTTVLTLGVSCSLVNCRVYDATATLVVMSSNGYINHCLFNECDGTQAIVITSGIITGCTFEDTASQQPREWISGGSGIIYIINNLFQLRDNTRGIVLTSEMFIVNNSFFGAAGTGTAVKTLTDRDRIVLLNNIVAGFSGSGGVGIDLRSGDTILAYGNNTFFDNETDTANVAGAWFGSANAVAGGSPYVDAAGDDFTSTAVGSIRGGSFPTDFLGLTATALDVNRGGSQIALIATGGGGSGTGTGRYKYRGLSRGHALGAS